MSTGSILLVDDETKILNALAQALREDRHEVVATTSAREAQRLLSQRMFDLLVVDNLMPELTGLDLIRELHTSGAADRPQIVMMTAHATVESAIEAMKLGAFDYLQKPFEVDELLVVANRALDHQRLRTEHRYLISERDAVRGKVVGERVIVLGKLVGEINGDAVTLMSSAHVEGDIQHKSLTIETGAEFKGRCKVVPFVA